MRVAILSDIHGNLMALEAVLADIAKQGVDRIICLGDIANLGPFPGDCIDLVRERCDEVLQGNHELYLLGRALDADWQTCPTWACLRWSRAQLRPDQFDYMAKLPFRHDLPHADIPAVAFHASPTTQFRGFLGRHTNAEVEKLMSGVDDTVLFCGHTHLGLLRRWSRSWIVNVGSVGMPLDGSPAASYVIATREPGGWQFSMRRLEYDRARLMAAFDESGLQAAGRMVTAVFRYQMLSGQGRISPYLNGMRSRAAELGVVQGEIYDAFPMPDEVPLAWVTGHG